MLEVFWGGKGEVWGEFGVKWVKGGHTCALQASNSHRDHRVCARVSRVCVKYAE